MGYYLQAIIGARSALQARAADYSNAEIARLNQGIGLIPITDGLLEEIGEEGAPSEFLKLTSGLTAWIEAISKLTPVGYVEADYFGGKGSQSSVFWEQGAEVWRVVQTQDAINRVLQRLQVNATGFRDEFDAVGLPRHRRTEEWVADP